LNYNFLVLVLLLVHFFKRMDSESNNNGSSKHRRQQLNKGVEQLKKAIPLSQEDSNKLSQLQTLHYACIYMRKQILISNLKETSN
jgi:hypothetical protein